jgi:hypothetical protein
MNRRQLREQRETHAKTQETQRGRRVGHQKAVFSKMREAVGPQGLVFPICTRTRPAGGWGRELGLSLWHWGSGLVARVSGLKLRGSPALYYEHLYTLSGGGCQRGFLGHARSAMSCVAGVPLLDSPARLGAIVSGRASRNTVQLGEWGPKAQSFTQPRASALRTGDEMNPFGPTGQQDRRILGRIVGPLGRTDKKTIPFSSAGRCPGLGELRPLWGPTTS